jgi:hypothetical protein
VFEPGSSEFGQWLTERGGYSRIARANPEPEYIVTPPEVARTSGDPRAFDLLKKVKKTKEEINF